MNRKIQEAWDISLGILKPSRKDLEHGLELHKNSVVIDGYGFTPIAALRSDALLKRFEKAEASEVKEIATEAFQTRCLTDKDERKEFEEAWLKSGVSCVIVNSGEEGQSPLRMLKRIAYRTEIIDNMNGFMMKAISPADILQAKESGKHALMFTTNGVPLNEQWNSIEDELLNIRLFHKLGVRMMHLTYNRRNMLGDGCAEMTNAGLSDFGRQAILEMNDAGVIVDISHSGWATSKEAAKTSLAPLVASHSCCVAVNKHCRAKPDDVIRAIADSGGYVGICCCPPFLGKTGDITAFLEHIDYIAKKFGPDYVAIGTDMAHVSSYPEDKRITKIIKGKKSRDRFEKFLKKEDPLLDEKWQDEKMVKSLAWTNFPLFTVGLVQRGYSDDNIRKILGGNIIRVLEDTAEYAIKAKCR
jgi:membrane dipeptidase